MTVRRPLDDRARAAAAAGACRPSGAGPGARRRCGRRHPGRRGPRRGQRGDERRPRSLGRMRVVELLSASAGSARCGPADIMADWGSRPTVASAASGPRQVERAAPGRGARRGRAADARAARRAPGPVGVGKGTVVAEVRHLRPDIWVSVSATTRAPRPGEVDGARTSSSATSGSTSAIAEDGLPRVGRVRRQPVRHAARRRSSEQLAAGQSVLLEIEVQGARQVRAAVPEALLVFLTPPSLGRAGGPAARPRHRGRRRPSRAGWPRPRRAGGRGGVRLRDRERRCRPCGRRLGRLGRDPGRSGLSDSPPARSARSDPAPPTGGSAVPGTSIRPEGITYPPDRRAARARPTPSTRW